MEDKTFYTINFEAIDLPEFIEVRGKEWVSYGKKNDWPEKMIDLYQSSAMHNTCIDAKVGAICGEGFIEYGDTPANLNGETLDEVFEKVALDYELFGGYSLNVIWSRAGDKIAEMYHIPFNNVRSGKMNEDDEVTHYYYSSNWNNTRKYKPVEYAAYSPTDTKGDNASQIFYYYSYSPGNDIYPLPDYMGAVNDIELDGRVSVLHNANISNGMTPGLFIVFPNGEATPEQRQMMYHDLTKTFSGEKNAGKMFLSFVDNASEAPIISTIDAANDDYYITLEQRISSRILTAHRITSPLLLGIRDSSGFSSNADEIRTAYDHFLGTVIIPTQKKLIKSFSQVVRRMGMNVKLEIEQAKILPEVEIKKEL